MDNLFKNNIFINHAKTQVSNHLKIPKELVFGQCVLTLRGNEELFVENYKGILECTDQFIWISVSNMRISIKGHELNVAYYNNDEMKVVGKISQISFME